MKKQRKKYLLSDQSDVIYEETKISSDKPASSTTSNQIFFYSPVTKESILDLNRDIDTISKNLQILKINYNLSFTPSIDLYINSDGGDLLASFSALDRISNNIVPVNTIVEGSAASAATIISVSGKNRYMREHSVMLIHSLSSDMFGNYGQLSDEMDNLDLLMDKIRKIYLKYTKLTNSDLDHLLKHDLYLDANTCLEKGLIDKII